MSADLDALLVRIRACRLCRDAPRGRPLPHEPRPVLRPSATARLLIASQAPGTRVHASGTPFTDRSGERLRGWLGLAPDTFYDTRRVAIVPMGFCFPGQSAAGADLPPRRECAPAWRPQVMAAMPAIELVLAIGRHALDWHRPATRGLSLDDLVGDWRAALETPVRPRVLALPHPSWRNNGWLRRHPWFEAELVPRLREEVSHLVSGGGGGGGGGGEGVRSLP